MAHKFLNCIWNPSIMFFSHLWNFKANSLKTKAQNCLSSFTNKEPYLGSMVFISRHLPLVRGFYPVWSGWSIVFSFRPQKFMISLLGCCVSTSSHRKLNLDKNWYRTKYQLHTTSSRTISTMTTNISRVSLWCHILGGGWCPQGGGYRLQWADTCPEF